jgi:ribosome biogenesis protein Nip4
MSAYVDICENKKIENLTQVSNDVAIISEKPEGIQAILKTLDVFTKLVIIDINVNKSITASYLFGQHYHRCPLTQCFKSNNQDIPNVTLL